MNRRWPTPCILFAAVLLCNAADPLEPIMGARTVEALHDALYCLNMTPSDIRFKKDVGDPALVLDSVRRTITEPLHLPVLADDVRNAAADGAPSATWALARSVFGTGRLMIDHAAVAPNPIDQEGLAAGLLDALNDFVSAVGRANDALRIAFSKFDREEMGVAIAATLSGPFAAEVKPDVRAGLMALGVSSQAVAQAIADENALDPEPAAVRYIIAVTNIHYSALFSAAERFEAAVLALSEAAAVIDEWPDQPVDLDTPLGVIRVGTRGDDRHTGAALLVLDPAGADVYGGEAGTANRLLGSGLAAVIDLAGDDHYAHAGLLGAAASVFGVAIVLDESGDDVYRAAHGGLGAGFFGVGILRDSGGDDIYRADALGIGCGFVGLGLLRDGAGSDLYFARQYGQGFAGIHGLGLLIDVAGTDRYLSGGRDPDFGRRADRYLTMTQGFAIGSRPYIGGGIGALVDLDGNDYYQCDMYGQGASYWYAVGLLLDEGGNDTYDAYQYCQGSGIHFGSGLLFDRAGNDLYNGYDICQGAAHDYSVGMLFDHSGHDRYTANDTAQGRGLHNAFALHVDLQGNDAYMGRNTGTCQGVGHYGGDREYGSLAVLLDLNGSDSYSCGAVDGARFIRPLYGIVYDWQEEAVGDGDAARETKK